jgi:hypothetical protein
MSMGSTDQDRTWGMICHLSALAMFTCIPFANIIAPLIVWLVKGKESSFVQDQGKEAVNFQITMSIISLILVVLNFIVPRIGMLGFIVLIVNVVFIIIAGLQAKQGNAYRYPFAIRLIK